MLAKRVILCLTFDTGVLMRTKKFRADLRYLQAFSWAPDADELVLVDVSTTDDDRKEFHAIVKKYCRESGLPMTVGGRVRSLDEAKRLFDLGADRVLVGLGGMNIYEDIAKTWGSQALVAGIDYRDGPDGTDVRDAVGTNVTDACRESEARGAGEILLTSIDRDGSLAGLDCGMVRNQSPRIGIPIVVAGGAGSWPHFKEAVEAGAQGACTTNIFHMNATAMRACKQWLAENYDGPVRPAA